MNKPETIDKPSHPAKKQATFKYSLDGIAYDGVPKLRAQLLEFCEEQGEGTAYAGRLALTVTEILTNLAKHPLQKAKHIEIRLRLSSKNAFIDITDDSTPFAEFDAKCESALARLQAAQSLEETGYGLGLILKQHAHCAYTAADKSPDGLNHFRVRDDRETADRAQERPRVFLVDDDPVALHRHLAMLEGEYAVIPFSRAQDAVPAFAQDKPDIVVSDLNMPDMDGISLRRALSALEGGDATPFVFLSAQTWSENNPYISALGVDDFLCKPVTEEKLRTIVARLLTRALQVRLSLEGKFQTHLTAMLKPDLPASSHGWRIATLSEMAEAGGGDFTLYKETPEGLFAVLADVMGHGPQAKFFSYAYAGYLRSLFRLRAEAPCPATFLKALADSIAGDDFLESVILTCQGFMLSASGRAAIATAGHPAPFVVRQDGARAVNIAGPLPALASEAGYSLLALDLRKGEKIVFTTDGFLQSFGAEGTGHAPLLQVMEEMAEAHAIDMAAALWRAHTANSKTHHKDDATLIVAEYGGKDE